MSFLERYRTPKDLPKHLAVFPLSGALLLPRADLPLNIFEPRYVHMVNDAMYTQRMIGMIQPDPASGEADEPKLLRVGCAGRITSYSETHDGRMLVTLTGVCRFTVTRELKTELPYRIVVPNYKPFAADLVVDKGAKDVNRPALIKAFRDYLEANSMSANWDEVDSAPTEVLVNTLSLMAPYPASEKQALLEAPDLKTRADVLVALTEIAIGRAAGEHKTLQ
jgi:hypothetical protein